MSTRNESSRTRPATRHPETSNAISGAQQANHDNEPKVLNFSEALVSQLQDENQRLLTAKDRLLNFVERMIGMQTINKEKGVGIPHDCVRSKVGHEMMTLSETSGEIF